MYFTTSIVVAVACITGSITAQRVIPSDAVSGYGESLARIASAAPDFSAEAVMPNGKIEEVTLSHYKGKYVVLLFYPMDFTFVCPTEILAFSNKMKEFKDIGAEVLGISTDSKFVHVAWTKTPREEGGLGEVNFPLVADQNMKISQAYGAMYAGQAHSARAMFIVDGTGKLRQIQIHDDGVGRSVEETLRIVKAFQHHDKVGEVCPSGWQPGDDTIKNTPDGKLEYFKKKFAGK
eukprot:m.24710 g.24710  ORF g.24710 m.24710 type:complete len:234 (-) comp13099_c0_seq3:194-895(-)